MTMRTHVLPAARRALGWAAVVMSVGAAACSDSPTAPEAAPRGHASTSVVKPQPNNGGAKRGGYNVVAD